MKKFTQLDATWSSVMDEKVNPLSNYSLPTAHMIMQLLAWMWSAIFSISFGSYYLFGVMAVSHIMVVAGLFITLMVFRGAEEKRRPNIN